MHHGDIILNPCAYQLLVPPQDIARAVLSWFARLQYFRALRKAA